MAKRNSHAGRALGMWLLGVACGAGAILILDRVAAPFIMTRVAPPALQKFFASYSDLHDSYYWKFRSTKLVDGAVTGMTSVLGDPFTQYFSPAELTQFDKNLSGTFDGIGVVLEQQQKKFIIVQVNAGGPAKKSGLRPNDVIVGVNGKSVKGMDITALSSRIIGKRGTKVRLSIQRPGVHNVLHFTLTREPITAPSVFHKMLPGKIGYLDISVMGADTPAETTSALQALTKAGAKGMIVDLRDNGGGYLEDAVNIAGDFIPKGKTVVKTEYRVGSSEVYTSPGPGMSLPVVVLMNGNTASAAEILSAALHDDIHAPLIGTKSYGKGTVQITQQFSDGSALKYTIGRWLTPTGTWIHHKGLQPDYKVQLLASSNTDTQLQKAEAVLRKLEKR